MNPNGPFTGAIPMLADQRRAIVVIEHVVAVHISFRITHDNHPAFVNVIPPQHGYATLVTTRMI